MPYSLTNYVTYDRFSTVHRKLLTTVTISVEPKTYIEAIYNPLWHKAMSKEVKALEKNGTCEVVDLQIGKKPIDMIVIFPC